MMSFLNLNSMLLQSLRLYAFQANNGIQMSLIHREMFHHCQRKMFSAKTKTFHHFGMKSNLIKNSAENPVTCIAKFTSRSRLKPLSQQPQIECLLVDLNSAYLRPKITRCLSFSCDAWTNLSHSKNFHRLQNPLINAQSRPFSDLQKSNTNKKIETGSLGVSKNTNGAKNNEGNEGPTLDPAKLTLYQRFKQTYKEHGKLLVAVHLVTSSIWFGSFYAAARLGVDVVPYLESWNFSEKIISPFRSGGLGDIALAYLLYKLATPARYTVTIGGTNLAIRWLRKGGKMKPISKENTLRSMYTEGKADLKTRRDYRVRSLEARFSKTRLGTRLKQRKRGYKR